MFQKGGRRNPIIRQSRQASPTLGFLRTEQIRTCDVIAGWLSDANSRGDAQGVIGHSARLASAQQTLARYDFLVAKLGESFSNDRVSKQDHLEARRMAGEGISPLPLGA